MSNDAVHPRARVVWCLRRRTGDVRCIAFFDAMPVEVRVLQDRDVVLTERFPSQQAALEWAHEYGARLKEHGWRDSADDAAAGPDVH